MRGTWVSSLARTAGIDDTTLSQRWLRIVRVMLPFTVFIEIVSLKANGAAIFDSSAFFLISAVPWFAIVVLSGTERYGRIGSSLAFLSLLIGIVMTFPDVSNHSWLTLASLGVLSLLDGRSPSQRLHGALVARVQVAAVLFYSGLHKFASGLWFDGTMLGSTTRFSESGPIVLLERAFHAVGVASAPETALTFASNATWLGEVTTGLGLLIAPVAVPAMILAILMLIVIEVAAHEFIFGAVMLILLSMSFNARWVCGLCLLAVATVGVRVLWMMIT